MPFPCMESYGTITALNAILQIQSSLHPTTLDVYIEYAFIIQKLMGRYGRYCNANILLQSLEFR